MSDHQSQCSALLSQLEEQLSKTRYNPSVVGQYLGAARDFLDYVGKRHDTARAFPSPRSPLRPLTAYTMLVLAYCAGLVIGPLRLGAEERKVSQAIDHRGLPDAIDVCPRFGPLSSRSGTTAASLATSDHCKLIAPDVVKTCSPDAYFLQAEG
jgi:hypothetical protein